MSHTLRRLLTTFTSKPIPTKAHHHVSIPSSFFPAGYEVTGLHAGVKKDPNALDLALIISKSYRPTSAAACFTRNAFKAAPVIVSETILQENGGRARAIVVNSGCANAVTGRQGLEDAWAMSKETDALLSGYNPNISETLVMSTGVIGQKLPISKISAAIKSQKRDASTRSLTNNFEAWEKAAKAFMTTDTFPKLRSRIFSINGKEYRLAGMDKGAGMIHPDMAPAGTSFTSGQSVGSRPLHATLLGCMLTDAPVSPRSLQNALTYAVQRSFNSISVDGDMSTNDTIFLFANGAAAEDAAPEIDEETDYAAYVSFRDELTIFAIDLAKLLVRDGEGATKFVTVTVKNAATYDEAHRIASRISTSALVKTALYGEDANWGRILAATGSVSLATPLNTASVNVSFVPSDGTSPLAVLINGEPENVDEDRASEILKQDTFEIVVDLATGQAEAQYFTCDFSYEYVRINGDYRS